MHGLEVKLSTQLRTKPLDTGIELVEKLLGSHLIDEIAIEDYRVYSWESDTHKWAELHTAKLIGGIVALCIMRDIPYRMRMAKDAKGFVTDDKLLAWDMYDKGKRHARDATRHAIYQLIFGNK